MKKKILLFSLAYYPKHIGGAEVAIKEITDRLPADKYEWHLIANRYDSTLSAIEQIGAVTVHRIGYAVPNPTMSDLKRLPLHLNKLWYQVLAFHKAVALHKEHQFSGIWAMMAHATGIPAARFKKKFPEVPYLLTLQEGDPPEQIEHTMRWFGSQFTDAFKLADRVQVISSFLGKWATKQGFAGVPTLIPNAVDVARFSTRPSDVALAAVRTAHHIPSDALLLITTSRLVPKNGIDTVIKALPLMPSDVVFIILGSGPEEAALKALAETLRVNNRVRFVGQVDHAELPAYLHAADIFIRPSRSEGMGNSFIEAMAARKPVIATMVGGIPDFLQPVGEGSVGTATGWAVGVDVPSDIAAAVNDIRLGGGVVRTVTETAAAMVATSYDWSLIAHRMENEVFRPLFQKSYLVYNLPGSDPFQPMGLYCR